MVGGFIDNQAATLLCEGSRERASSCFAAGQGCDGSVCEFLQPEPMEGVFDGPGIMGTEGDPFSDGETAGSWFVLWHIRQCLSSFFAVQGGNRPTVDQANSFLGTDCPVERGEQGRFPGAVGTLDDNKFTRAHGEIDRLFPRQVSGSDIPGVDQDGAVCRGFSQGPGSVPADCRALQPSSSGFRFSRGRHHR